MADDTSSFWGPVTSSTEWCEKNYVYSSYVAEFYNTISNIPCILLALIGLINSLRQRFEKRFSILHLSNMALTIGSVMYHATLEHVSYKSFYGIPLGPLQSMDRIMFVHKSGIHYVLTSYLQPLLMWCGAILICRSQ